MPQLGSRHERSGLTMRRVRVLALAVAVAVTLTACGPDCDQLATDYAAAEFVLALHLDSASGLDLKSLDDLNYRLCMNSAARAAQCEAKRRDAQRQRAERVWQLEAERVAARDALRAACSRT